MESRTAAEREYSADGDGMAIPSPADDNVAKRPAGQAEPPAPAAPVAKPAAGEKKPAAQADPAAVKADAPPNPVSPMIVYSATLDVIVKDLDAATPEVEKLVASHKGFVAKSEVKGDSGARRTATYTLRVPAAAFGPLKGGLLALGTPERNVVDTQDVTEEFVDVEARIKNLKEQEDKLNELLKEKRKEEKLEDVIKVSDRIYAVRGDIERAQGRRNYLQNRVQLSTISVTLREIKDYKPPTAPTFGSRVSDTLQRSWEVVIDFAQGLAIAAVALVPWSPLWVPALVGGLWLRRRARAAREADRAEREAGRAARRRVTAEASAAEPANPSSPDEPKPPA
jgi:hypothetical protein